MRVLPPVLFRCLLGLLLAALPARAEHELLEETFDGLVLDLRLWLLPAGPGTFFGRTQIRAPWPPPSLVGGRLLLRLDTHNPTALRPGDSFLGSEIRTREYFPLEEGLAFEARLRFVDDAGEPVPPGIVGGFFSFTTDGMVRDEIDFELLSNELRAARNRVLTNVFSDDDFSQPGNKAFAVVPGLDLGAFHLYRVEWRPDRIRWFVDGVLVREVLERLPDEPMNVRVNIWVPHAGFAEAYDAGLVPTADPSANRTFLLEVDEVRVTRLPEPSAGLAGLLALAACAALARLSPRRS
ncbi:MAG: glycoside hydrolase family 16 protein [Myxococcota bacterium]